MRCPVSFAAGAGCETLVGAPSASGRASRAARRICLQMTHKQASLQMQMASIGWNIGNGNWERDKTNAGSDMPNSQNDDTTLISSYEEA